MTDRSSITIRVARPGGDDAVLHRLAQLDSADDPAAPALLALVDGEPAAALSLADGRAIADPFRRTADAVELLRLRARIAA
jgi:hypothetical protein